MLKENHKSILFARVFLDSIVIIASWLGAYFIRFKIVGGAQANLGNYFIKLTVFVLVVFLLSLKNSGVYSSNRFKTWYKEFSSIVLAVFHGGLITVSFFYIFLPERVSRMTIFIFLILVFLVLTVVKITVRNIIQKIRKSGRNLRHVLLVGHGTSLNDYVKKIKSMPFAGVEFFGWFDGGEGNSYNIQELGGELSEIIDTRMIDLVVIAYPEKENEKEKLALRKCYNKLVPVIVLPSLPYSVIGTYITEFKGLPMLVLNQPSISMFQRAIKRTIDIILSAAGGVLLSPLLIIITLLVKLTSRGPVFYGQERMTVNGKKFKMWKFRSMRVGADKIGSGWTVKDDPRRTPIGAFLRSTSIDELPQIFNILIGQMSIVGPRPERPVFIDQFKEEIPNYMLRHKVKGGLTGWAQINGWRGDTSIESRIECDIYYIKNWSLLLDLKIVFLTFIKGFINKNAY